MIAFAFTVFGLLIIGACAYSTRRYGSLLNPICFYCVLSMGYTSLMPGIIAVNLHPASDYAPGAVVMAIAMCVLHLLGFLAAFSLIGAWPVTAYGRMMSAFGLDNPAIARSFRRPPLWVFLTISLVLFAGLMLGSGQAGMWLTSPRQAYEQTREGVTMLWAGAEWFLLAGLLYYLYSRRPGMAMTVVAVLCYSVAASRLGSKSMILLGAIVALLHYHFRCRRLTNAHVVAAGVAGALGGASLLFIQGTSTNLLAAGFYFQSYFDTSAQFLSKFDLFGFQYGKATLSSLWYYVPRALYPDKPIEFGATLINKILYPGYAAIGWTPAGQSWDVPYLDFGPIGVFVDAVWVGLIHRCAYEYYLRRPGMVSFLLMVNWSFLPVLVLATPVLVLLIGVTVSITSRLVFADPPAERPIESPATNA